jgi:hypothetical protein
MIIKRQIPIAVAAWAACAMTLLPLQASGQSLATPDEAETAAAEPVGQTRDAAPEWNNPWAARPVCASMFLKSDWQLTQKQRACNWIQNGIFSTSGMLAAVGAAEFSKLRDAPSERGDGFPVRFGRKFAQSAFKSTGAYLGAIIAHEDPRKAPPYLGLRTAPHPTGFFKRTAHALGGNVISSHCVNRCTADSDIRPRFALSTVLGSAASGFAGELLATGRPYSHDRALRGVASAYAATFVNALLVEFKPELSAFAGRTFRLMGGH